MEKIIQISSGRGPLECCWVVAQVLKFILEDAKQHNISHSILSKINGSENGTVQSVSVLFKGDNVNSFLNPWIGTVQWIGQSQYRKHHKRKNWFIGIYELSFKTKITVNDNDITYQTMRSQGKGGQHVNKVNTAVRAIHKTTGLAVVSMDSRSQLQNKKLAKARLIEKLNEFQIPNNNLILYYLFYY